MPLLPSRVFRQNASRPIPLGLTAPIPLITTLRFMPDWSGNGGAGETPCVSIGMSKGAEANGLAQHPSEMFHPRLKAAVTGLEAGVLGGFAMLGALAGASIADQDAWWRFPNLLASTFYGARVLRSGPGWPTISGVALQIVIAGLAGAIFGALFGKAPGALRIVLGFGWGALLFYASEMFYRRIAPFVALYQAETSTLLGHVLYGLCLARMRPIARPVNRRAPAGANRSGELVQKAAPVAVLESPTSEPDSQRDGNAAAKTERDTRGGPG